MNPLVKRAVLLGVVSLAGAAVLANVIAHQSDLPSMDPSAAAATATPAIGAPAPAATAQPEAVTRVQQRLADNPNDPSALADYGDMLMQAKRYPQAADAYAQLVDVQPQDAVAHGKLGTAFFYQGMTTLAQKELKRAIDLDPNDVQAQFNYALTMSHGPKADPAAANASWQAVARLDPNGELGQQAMKMLAAAASSGQPAQAAPPAAAAPQPQAQARP